MAKTKKPAPKRGGMKKGDGPKPAQKMRRKSKRALNSTLPHYDPAEVSFASARPAPAPAPKPTLWHRFRSAITGRWVKPLFAKLNPSTTVREKASK